MHDFADPIDPQSLGGRFRRLVGGCFVSLALLLSVAYGAIWWQMQTAQNEARRSLDWPRVAAVITQSEVEEMRGVTPTDARPTRRPGPAFRAVVAYEYSFEGTDYSGGRLELRGTIEETAAAVERALEPFPIGAETVVSVDPEDPDRSVLIPGPATFDNTYFYAFGGGFLAIFIAIAFVARQILRAASPSLLRE